MRNPNAAIAATLALLALASTTSAQAEAGRTTPAEEAFARLRTLTGEWQGSFAWTGARTDHGEMGARYYLSGGGSALVEDLLAAGQPVMSSVYHLDGADLRVTHYCGARNQPRLKAQRIDLATGELDFAFVDITNLRAPDAPHVDGLKVRLVDDAHLELRFSFVAAGKRSEEIISFARAGAAPASAPAPAAGTGPTPAPPHGVEYWRAIRAHEFAVPAGENVVPLLGELSALLGSPDAELRDDFAYDIPAAWIYRDHRVEAQDLRPLLATWEGNLRAKVGEVDTDSVLLRSFSALDLSLLAALDLQRPFLDQPAFDGLLAAALDYLGAEKDVRGFDPRVGWIHATAHTADLVKFLARNPKLRAADAARILDAFAAKLGAVQEPLTRGETERMARAVLSLAMRKDATAAPLTGFVHTLVERERAVWRTTSRPATAAFAPLQNGRDLRAYLSVLLDQQAELAPPAQELRRELLTSLK